MFLFFFSQNDEEGKSLLEELQESKKKVAELDILVKGLTMLISGEVPIQTEAKVAQEKTDPIVSHVEISDNREIANHDNPNMRMLEEENKSLTNANEVITIFLFSFYKVLIFLS